MMMSSHSSSIGTITQPAVCPDDSSSSELIPILSASSTAAAVDSSSGSSSAAAGSAPTIVVAVRVRPMSAKEHKSGASSVVAIAGQRIAIVDPLNIDLAVASGKSTAPSHLPRRVFAFDAVYGPTPSGTGIESSQLAVFQDCGARIVEHALGGYNCSVFAYGQTGTGKTYTMLGGLKLAPTPAPTPLATIATGGGLRASKLAIGVNGTSALGGKAAAAKGPSVAGGKSSQKTDASSLLALSNDEEMVATPMSPADLGLIPRIARQLFLRLSEETSASAAVGNSSCGDGGGAGADGAVQHSSPTEDDDGWNKENAYSHASSKDAQRKKEKGDSLSSSSSSSLPHFSDFAITASFLEIYCEKIRDLLLPLSPIPPKITAAAVATENQSLLLPPGPSPALKVREHPVEGVCVPGLTEMTVKCYEDVEKLLKQGCAARSVAETRSNDVSSRSHAVFTLKLVRRGERMVDSTRGGGTDTDAVGIQKVFGTPLQKDTKAGPSSVPSSSPSWIKLERRSKVVLVDLAGSERYEAASPLPPSSASLSTSTSISASIAAAAAAIPASSSFSSVPFGGVEAGGGSGGDGTGGLRPPNSQQRLKESSKINTSLSALGAVIKALSTAAPPAASANAPSFIPYRNSVLTWLLKDSLGGNALTTMIATVSPVSSAYAETLTTLKYCEGVKRIVTKPTVNDKTTFYREETVQAVRPALASLNANGANRGGEGSRGMDDLQHLKDAATLQRDKWHSETVVALRKEVDALRKKLEGDTSGEEKREGAANDSDPSIAIPPIEVADVASTETPESSTPPVVAISVPSRGQRLLLLPPSSLTAVAMASGSSSAPVSVEVKNAPRSSAIIVPLSSKSGEVEEPVAVNASQYTVEVASSSSPTVSSIGSSKAATSLDDASSNNSSEGEYFGTSKTEALATSPSAKRKPEAHATSPPASQKAHATSPPASQKAHATSPPASSASQTPLKQKGTSPSSPVSSSSPATSGGVSSPVMGAGERQALLLHIARLEVALRKYKSSGSAKAAAAAAATEAAEVGRAGKGFTPMTASPLSKKRDERGVASVSSTTTTKTASVPSSLASPIPSSRIATFSSRLATTSQHSHPLSLIWLSTDSALHGHFALPMLFGLLAKLTFSPARGEGSEFKIANHPTDVSVAFFERQPLGGSPVAATKRHTITALSSCSAAADKRAVVPWPAIYLLACGNDASADSLDGTGGSIALCPSLTRNSSLFNGKSLLSFSISVNGNACEVERACDFCACALAQPCCTCKESVTLLRRGDVISVSVHQLGGAAEERYPLRLLDQSPAPSVFAFQVQDAMAPPLALKDSAVEMVIAAAQTEGTTSHPVDAASLFSVGEDKLFSDFSGGNLPSASLISWSDFENLVSLDTSLTSSETDSIKSPLTSNTTATAAAASSADTLSRGAYFPVRVSSRLGKIDALAPTSFSRKMALRLRPLPSQEDDDISSYDDDEDYSERNAAVNGTEAARKTLFYGDSSSNSSSAERTLELAELSTALFEKSCMAREDAEAARRDLAMYRQESESRASSQQAHFEACQHDIEVHHLSLLKEAGERHAHEMQHCLNDAKRDHAKEVQRLQSALATLAVDSAQQIAAAGEDAATLSSKVAAQHALIAAVELEKLDAMASAGAAEESRCLLEERYTALKSSHADLLVSFQEKVAADDATISSLREQLATCLAESTEWQRKFFSSSASLADTESEHVRELEAVEAAIRGEAEAATISLRAELNAHMEAQLQQLHDSHASVLLQVNESYASERLLLNTSLKEREESLEALRQSLRDAQEHISTANGKSEALQTALNEEHDQRMALESKLAQVHRSYEESAAAAAVAHSTSQESAAAAAAAHLTSLAQLGQQCTALEAQYDEKIAQTLALQARLDVMSLLQATQKKQVAARDAELADLASKLARCEASLGELQQKMLDEGARSSSLIANLESSLLESQASVGLAAQKEILFLEGEAAAARKLATAHHDLSCAQEQVAQLEKLRSLSSSAHASEIGDLQTAIRELATASGVVELRLADVEAQKSAALLALSQSESKLLELQTVLAAAETKLREEASSSSARIFSELQLMKASYEGRIATLEMQLATANSKRADLSSAPASAPFHSSLGSEVSPMLSASSLPPVSASSSSSSSSTVEVIANKATIKTLAASVGKLKKDQHDLIHSAQSKLQAAGIYFSTGVAGGGGSDGKGGVGNVTGVTLSTAAPFVASQVAPTAENIEALRKEMAKLDAAGQLLAQRAAATDAAASGLRRLLQSKRSKEGRPTDA